VSATTGRRRPGAAAQPKGCHDRALGLLAVRPRARRELERRLLAAGFDALEVTEVLDRLERVGLIDDRAFARQMAEYQFGSRRAGRRAVTSGLMAKGIAADLVEETVLELADDEEERALELARSRTTRLGGLEPAKAFGRLSSFLMRRGYAPDVARAAARTALSVDDPP
jgi:regulatory protein